MTRRRAHTGLWLLALIGWCWIYAGAGLAVRQLLFGNDVGVVYSDHLVPGQATIEACRPDHPMPYTCTARIEFEGVTTGGEPAPSCWASEVRSVRPLTGTVPVLGHYSKSGRTWRCALAATTDYPHLPPDRESALTAFTWVFVIGLVAWVLLGGWLSGVVTGRRRRRVAAGAGGGSGRPGRSGDPGTAGPARQVGWRGTPGGRKRGRRRPR